MKKMFQKSLFKIMLFVLVLGLFVALPQNTAFAAVQTQELVHVSSPCDILVQVIYDGAAPKSIVFISPSGARLEPGVTPKSQLVYFEGKAFTNYKIINAETGTWQIEYDKGKSKNAQFSASLSTQNLAVNSFVVNKIDGTDAEVSFTTLYDGSSISYNYEIYAVAGANAAEGHKLLATGSATTENTVTRTVDLSSLTSYGAYKLRLEVYADNGSFEIFDSADSAEFSFTNPKTTAPLDGIDISVDTKSMLVTVNWGAHTSGSNLFISAFADDDAEPIFYQDVAGWESDELYFDYLEGHAKLTVNVYRRENGLLSAPLTKEFSVKNFAVTIDTPEATNQALAKISYDIDESTDATVLLNDATQTVRLDGKDSFALTLLEGENNLSVTYMENGIKFIIAKTISLDKMPPLLDLYEKLDKKKVTTQELMIAGSTEAAATVKIGGKAVKLSDKGEFAHTVQLKPGENTIHIQATDIAGNTTSRTLLIICDAKSATAAGLFSADGVSYLPLLISLAVSLIAIVLAILFIKKRQTRKVYRKELPLSVNMLNIASYASILLAVIACMAVVFGIIHFVTVSEVINDISFMDIAEKSFDAAQEYLAKRTASIWTMVIGGVLAILFLVLSFVFKNLYKKKLGR